MNTDLLIKIKDSMDPEELIDRLGLSTDELCDILIDYIEERLDKFEDVIEESIEE